MPPSLTRPLGLCLLVVLLSAGPLCRTLHALGESPTSPPPRSTQHHALVQRHNQLARQLNVLWQKGENEKTFAGLKELLAIYEQLYPINEFPVGHPHIVRCYRDLCKVSQELEDFEALLHFSQEGLAMCERLFPREKFPHGHVQTACMLGNVAYAFMWNGPPSMARRRLLEAIAMNHALKKNGLSRLDTSAIADLYRSVAATYLREGKDIEALRYTTLAVKQCQQLDDGRSYLEHLRLTARCLLRHGQTQINVCDYRNATETLQQALDLRLNAFLAAPSPATRLDLIDTHITLANLCRQKSDLPSVRIHLQHALRELEWAERKRTLLSSQLPQLQARITRTKRAELVGKPSTVGITRDGSSQQTSRTGLSGLNGTEERFYTLLDSAAACQKEGDLRGAKGILHSANKLARNYADACGARHCHPIVVWSELHLGRLCKNSGDFREAHSYFASSLSAARKLYPKPSYPEGHAILALTLHYAATQLWLLGETDMAAELFRESMLMNERLYPVRDFPRGHRQLMASYSAWGSVLDREGDLDEATQYFAKALKIAVAQFSEAEYPHGHDELARVWRDLGRLERARGHYDNAFKHFHKALASYERRYAQDVFPDGHLLLALSLSELGRTYLAIGDDKRAEQLFQRSLAMRRRLFSVDDFPDGHPNLATALRDLGSLLLASARYDEAFLVLAESAHMEQTVAETFVGGGSEALLLNLAASKFQSLDGLLDAWCHTDRPAAEAYQHVWQRRGFVPRLIAKRHRALRAMHDAGDATNREAYLQVRRDLSRALLVSASRDLEEDTLRLETIRRLNARKETLGQQLMNQLSPFDAEDAAQNGPQRLVEVLPRGAVLVDFVKYREEPASSREAGQKSPDRTRLLAFVVCSNQPIMCVQMGAAAPIEKMARNWRDTILDRPDDRLGTQLRQALWDPICRYFPDGVDTVYIAPDGALSLVPWNALPLADKRRFLIERYAIATLPYGQFLLEALTRPSTTARTSNTVLAVGKLDYGAPPDRSDTSTLGLKQLTWTALRGSGTELDALEAAVGRQRCVRLTGDEATTERVLELLPNCRWAHFATHGFFVDDPLRQLLQLTCSLDDKQKLVRNPSRTAVFRRNPFVRSGLALSGANELGPLDPSGLPTEVTGILTAEMVTAVDCSTLELAVLSACETGCGDVVHGDGVFGIQTAFHVAGTRNVIASLWKIDDAATAELMAAFYHALGKQGMTPAAALRAAQLKLLHRSRTRHPISRGPVLTAARPLPKIADKHSRSNRPNARHWAAFTLSGPGF